jgi:hypothetical protein
VELGRQISRRDVLRTLGLFTAGVALGACTPLRIITRAYPDEFKHGGDKVERVLRAFVITVIPGAPANSRDLVRAYFDRAYPFAPYAAFFASDLCDRAGERFGRDRFWELELGERTQVIRNGLAADATTRKLYGGAIFLAQVSFYGGIYDDAAGCPLIDFPGFYRGDAVSYDNAERFLPAPLTTTGNPA